MIEGEAGILEAECRDIVIDEFVDQAMESGKKPDSFVGVGIRATTSCEIRRRGSNQPLSAEVLALMDEHKIPYDKKEKVPARFVINPDLDQATLQKLAQLLETHKDFKNEVVVMQQEEEFDCVVSDATIEAVAQLEDRDLCRGLMERIATFAIGKHQFDGASIVADDAVTPQSKAIAIAMLQDIGVLPKPEIVESVRKRKA